VSTREPVFHSAGATREPARLARVGGATGLPRQTGTASAVSDVGIVAMIGPHVWVWREGAFQIIDVREW
jgi:hypothetical protein